MAFKRSYENIIKNHYVNLSDYPSAKTEYSTTLSSLTGGLNVWELEYMLDNDESPEMQNLLWREGVLNCRDGQVWAFYNYEKQEEMDAEVNGTLLTVTIDKDTLRQKLSAYSTDTDPVISGTIKCSCYEGTDFKLHWDLVGSYETLRNHTASSANTDVKLSDWGLTCTDAESGDDFTVDLIAPEVTKTPYTFGDGISCYDKLWHDYGFIHAGTELYAVNVLEDKYFHICSILSKTRGSWFVYGDDLYYKTKGSYVKISYNSESETFSATDAAENAYIPVTYMNAPAADGGAGTEYQPENRLSSKKTVWYSTETAVTPVSNGNLSVDVHENMFRDHLSATYSTSGNWVNGSVVFTYSGSSWVLSGTISDSDGKSVTLSGNSTPSEFYVNYVGALTSGDVITISLITEKDYYLPIKNIDSVEKVVVDGVVLTSDKYSVDLEKGLISFVNAPKSTVPATLNTVQITYSKENTVAKNNIMDCTYAVTYGGTGSLCIVMAGSSTQPNAYFWNGQTSISVDPTYFPMEQYQLAGDTNDPITGFGKQQSYLIIFKNNSVGRSSLETVEVNERNRIDLAYVQINSGIGCDLPWSIQLVENNLVWANKRHGVYFLSNTTSAYENNVVHISQKVNGTEEKKALLYDLRHSSSTDTICSVDFDNKYILVTNGHAWVWDYEISTYKDPSWFYLTNINARGLYFYLDDLWHLDAKGRITHFENIFADYGLPIEKIYKFAVQNFSSYDALKNVNSVVISTRSDTNSIAELTYITDYETRKDLTPLNAHAWNLVPRNLSFRSLGGRKYAMPFRRRPFCRHVRHFTMRLYNNELGQDLSIISATIFYNYQGRERARQYK